MKLPNMQPEILARLVFCFENNPEREDGFISGAQDAIGICVPGLCRHYYNGHFWPEKIEMCNDETTLAWLEQHLCMIPMEPRSPNCSVVEGKNITPAKVAALTRAADACWEAIMAHNLDAFANAYRASFEAQVAMFPGMLRPTILGLNSQTSAGAGDKAGACHDEEGNFITKEEGSFITMEESSFITKEIAKWAAVPGVLAWKMPGAGGGGYLALVVDDVQRFCSEHIEAIPLKIRRKTN